MLSTPHTVLALALTAGLASAPEGAAPPERGIDDEVVLKIATVAPDGSTWMNVLEKMKKEVYLRTRGRVSFKYFPGGIAGEESTVLEKIRYGQLHGAAFTGAGMGEILPVARIMELPFYFATYEDYDYVLERMLPEFEAGFRENGFELLGWAEGGFANLFSRKPVGSLDELRETKAWLRTNDPMLEKSLELLELQPVPLALQDVLTSLQTGLVDTVYVSPLAVVAMQWFPHVDYAFRTPLFNIEASLLVANEAFEEIGEDDRQVVRDVCAKHIRALVDATRADNAEAEEVLVEKGIRFQEPVAGQEAELLEARQLIARGLVGELYDEETLERFEALVAEAAAARDEAGADG